MTTSAEWTAIAARIEAATGPDMEIDALILCAAIAPEGAYVEKSSFNGAWCIHTKDRNGRERLFETRKPWWRPGGWPVTSSLDAITSLIERDLPDAVWHVMTDWGDLRRGGIDLNRKISGSVSYFSDRPHYLNEDAATPVLALCLAYVRAKAAMKAHAEAAGKDAK